MFDDSRVLPPLAAAAVLVVSACAADDREETSTVMADAGESDGEGAEDVLVGESIQLVCPNASLGGPLTWLVAVRPPGSAAAIAPSPSRGRATFVPDLAGRYVVECRIEAVELGSVVESFEFQAE